MTHIATVQSWEGARSLRWKCIVKTSAAGEFLGDLNAVAVAGNLEAEHLAWYRVPDDCCRSGATHLMPVCFTSLRWLPILGLSAC